MCSRTRCDGRGGLALEPRQPRRLPKFLCTLPTFGCSGAAPRRSKVTTEMGKHTGFCSVARILLSGPRVWPVRNRAE
jgi:hypothetical protein